MKQRATNAFMAPPFKAVLQIVDQRHELAILTIVSNIDIE